VHLQDYKILLRAMLPLLLLGALVLLYYTFNPAHFSFFLPCPLYYTTDLYCAGCGSQRAIHHLMHFDVFSAFRYNPLLVLTMPLLIYALALEYINFVTGSKHRVKLFYSNIFILVYFGIAIVYSVLRNIPHEPFNYLAPLN
jgi:hypothetical protein